MTTVLAVDPGLRGTSWSSYRDGELTDAMYVPNTERKARGPKAWAAMAWAVNWSLRGLLADVLVLEVPQVYTGGRRGGDPADLIELAGVDGAIVGAVDAGDYVGYLPREWKGQVPKDIHNARTMAKLTPEERARITPVAASLMHNVIDAIGIGMFYVVKQGVRK